MTYASAGLISYLSISYLLAKLSELFIHRLGSPKCMVAGISVCTDIYFFIERVAKQKKGFILFLHQIQLPFN